MFPLKGLCPQAPSRYIEAQTTVALEGMLSNLGRKDIGVFDEVVERTNPIGHVPRTGPYPQTFKPAKASPEEVIKNAAATRSAILGAVRALKKSSRTRLPPGQPFLELCVPRVMLTPRL